MTIEEKAKAYDEALKRAIKHHNKDGLTLEQYETIDIIFPELRESEDEKIRKALIFYLGDMPEDTELRNGVTNRDALVWLEKQGNNKEQINLPYFTFDDVLALQCCMEIVKKVQEDKELYEALLILHDKVHDAYHLEKQGSKFV